MKISEIILYASLLLNVVCSCDIDKKYHTSRNDIIGEWQEIDVPGNSSILFLEDSTFIANNIYDIRINLGPDSIMIGNEYKYYEKYQTHGIVGKWWNSNDYWISLSANEGEWQEKNCYIVYDSDLFSIGERCLHIIYEDCELPHIVKTYKKVDNISKKETE